MHLHGENSFHQEDRGPILETTPNATYQYEVAFEGSDLHLCTLERGGHLEVGPKALPALIIVLIHVRNLKHGL